MVKNWADHCSTDDEDDAAERNELLEATEEQQEANAVPPKEEPSPPDEENHSLPQDAPKKRTYDFPSEPPYTAYVGNLAYSVLEPNDLADELVRITQVKLGKDIKIVSARIMMDRRSHEKPRHRGFGYVQLETLDQLKVLMELNDTETILAGRKIQLDTANDSHRQHNNRRTSDSSNIDGSKFRGGRHSKRGSESSGHGGGGGGGSGHGGSAGHRPSLKLQPRTKPIEGGAGSGGSASNIFGSGKARDETSWQERRKSATKEDDHDNQKRRNSKGGHGHHRGSGRGGGGRGGVRSSGRKDGNNADAGHGSNKAEMKTDVKKTDTPEPEKRSTTKVTNKFAALDFDSDSD